MAQVPLTLLQMLKDSSTLFICKSVNGRETFTHAAHISKQHRQKEKNKNIGNWVRAKTMSAVNVMAVKEVTFYQNNAVLFASKGRDMHN